MDGNEKLTDTLKLMSVRVIIIANKTSTNINDRQQTYQTNLKVWLLPQSLPNPNGCCLHLCHEGYL